MAVVLNYKGKQYKVNSLRDTMNKLGVSKKNAERLTKGLFNDFIAISNDDEKVYKFNINNRDSLLLRRKFGLESVRQLLNKKRINTSKALISQVGIDVSEHAVMYVKITFQCYFSEEAPDPKDNPIITLNIEYNGEYHYLEEYKKEKNIIKNNQKL